MISRHLTLWDRFGSFPYGSIVTENVRWWLWRTKKSPNLVSRYFRFQLPFSVSVIGSVTVGLVLTQDNELGEVLVAVMGGSTPAKVVTSTGASVQVDAAVLQQLGTTWEERCGCFFSLVKLYWMMCFFVGPKFKYRCGSANCFGTNIE